MVWVKICVECDGGGLERLFNGPEKTAAITAPEVAAAFKNIFINPATPR